MSRLAFWSAPVDEDVDTIKVFSSATVAGPWVEKIRLTAQDGYTNWVTHYMDTSASTTTYYYAEFLKSGLVVETSPVRVGETPYTVTPEMVFEQIQGLPLNRVSASLCQRQIQWAVEKAELIMRMTLSETTVTKEVHTSQDFNKVVGSGVGFKIQLRHFPVTSVDNVYYKVRGAIEGAQEWELEDLDIQIEHGNGLDDYNRGMISVYPRQTTVRSIFTGLALTNYPRMAVNLLISYKHGFTSWPRGLAQVIAELAAACVMEIAGEADTAGLSSRSVDGYSETYTASATTTIFSARRIWYETHVKELLKMYRKPLWG